MITEAMFLDCINNPVRSRTHDFKDGEQAQYDWLAAAGRSLYDNLRTKYDIDHKEAFSLSLTIFGRKTVFF